jgi:Mg2+-importing ATPase
MRQGVLLAARPSRPGAGARAAFPGVDAYWSHSAAEALDRLGSGRNGLRANEAARRLQLHGPNEVEDATGTASVRLLLRQFQSPLVLILLAGAGVSLLLRTWLDATIILAIVIGSALLGFGQEYRASAAVAALRRRLALRLTAVRDGVEVTVPVSTLVPGDLVRLSAGSLVPGDGLVLEADDFLVSEAGLTGESFPVAKHPGVLPEDTPLVQRCNCVFLGTSVRSGCATVLIFRTGRATAYGAIAAHLAARPEDTEFTQGLRRFGQLLMRTVVLVMLTVIAANQLLGRPALESLLFAMALSVGMTPELLPAIVSVTLSRGARVLATKGVLVRRLEAIENLGSIDVLCTDKTGTLTEGAITLCGAVDTGGHPSDEVQRLAFLNAAFETGIANPVDEAIIAAAQSRNWHVGEVRKVEEIPYDFSRKRLSVIVQEPSATGHLIITKGAFLHVLAVCSIESAVRDRCERYFRQRSDEGFRVLAVAVRRGAPMTSYTQDDERAMTLVGFLLLLDPPKPDAAATLVELARLGIRTKIISGDNRYAVAHVARTIGLDSRAMLTGEQLMGTHDEALWSLAPRTDIFVEVDPQQKERIVRALQRTGHAVGYLGDGINDAPALRAADVGISVDSAVDVARESADIVLLERSLAVLRRGVEEGRATFANTMKYIGITISANFGNMISMAIATPLLPFLPLSAKQILLNNFISDLPLMAVSTDRVDAQRLESVQRWHLGDIRRDMIVFGLVSTVFDLLTFALLLWIFRVPQALFQTTWFLVSLLTELAVVLVLRTEGPVWGSVPGRLLAWVTGLAAAAAFMLIYAPAPGRMFGFVPLPVGLLAAALGIVVLYAIATEAAKRLVFR